MTQVKEEKYFFYLTWQYDTGRVSSSINISIILMEGFTDMPQTATITDNEVDNVTSNHQFIDDMRAFNRIYRASRASWRNGEDPLEGYFSPLANILGDEISPAGNMFGVEFEFDVATESDVNRIAQALYSAGILPHNNRAGYHARYYETREWRFEYDATVSGGEVITPILRDTPTSWNTLRNAVNTIVENGGRAYGTNAGGHVSIDASALEDSDFERLITIARKFEDVMYRLGTNPHRAKHATSTGEPMRMSTHRRRANGHCEPITGYHFGRSLWLYDDDSRHRLEYRVFDGTLDPGLVQTNILIATAMTRASMKSNLDDVLQELPDRPLGWHRAQEWRTSREGNRPRLTGVDWANDTQAIRQFVDLLFDNTQDKERVITLFALNDWSFARRNRNNNSSYYVQF